LGRFPATFFSFCGEEEMTRANARSKSFGSSDAPTSRAVSKKRLWRSASVSLGFSVLRGILCSLLCWTFFISTIVLPHRDEPVNNVGRIGIALNLDLPKFQSFLGRVQNTRIKSVVIGYIDQQIPEKSIILHLQNLIEWKAAPRRFGRMRPYFNWGIASERSSSLMYERPRLMQIIDTGRASYENMGIFRRGVSTVYKRDQKIECDGFAARINGNPLATVGDRQESPLANNVVDPDKVSLAGADTHYNESKDRIGDSCDRSPPWPFRIFFLLTTIILVGSVAIYLISQGVDANFNVAQIGLGSALLLVALLLLVVGIIHGELVPRWLSTYPEENSAISLGVCVLMQAPFRI
jgi:hypothetical protein